MAEQHGKFGKDRHFKLTKKALIHVVDKYWETFGTIQVENKHVWVSSRLLESPSFLKEGNYTLNPDIVVVIAKKSPNDGEILRGLYSHDEKVIIVECETSTTNLLKDEMRLTAYKLLRLGTPDKNKLMMYIAFPSELKGRVEKPECFNDLLFFDVPRNEEAGGGC